MKGELNYEGTRLTAQLTRDTDSVKLRYDDREYDYSLVELGVNRWLLSNSHGQVQGRVARDKDRLLVWISGRTFELHVASGESAGGDESGGGVDEARAPMPGTLIKLMVKTGDPVEQGQVLAILEAMKMEHQIRAPRSGVVAAVAGAVGTIIDAGALVVSLEAEPTTA